jgi:hypothetical protein
MVADKVEVRSRSALAVVSDDETAVDGQEATRKTVTRTYHQNTNGHWMV